MEKEQKTIRKGVSSLLNLPGHHSTAAISGYVIRTYHEVKDAENKNNTIYAIEGELSISDCNKSIHLDLSIYHCNTNDSESLARAKADRQNNLYKLRTLIEKLTELEKYYLEVTECI